MWSRKNIITAVLKNAAKAAVTALIALAVALVLGGQIKKSGVTVLEAQRLNFVLEKRTETIAKIKKDFEIIGEADKAIESVVPPTENILGFVAALETLGNQIGVSQSFRFGQPVPLGGPGLQALDYDGSVSGSFPTFISYLERFEGLSYFTSVSGLSLSAAGSGGLEGGGQMSLRANVYVR